MKNLRTRLTALAILAVCALFCLAAKPASAATVYTNVHNLPHAYYNIYLFRVGDAQPTQTYSNVLIGTGGYQANFSGVSGGDWFIRVEMDPAGGTLVNQTPAGHLNFYYSTPLHLPDLYM